MKHSFLQMTFTPLALSMLIAMSFTLVACHEKDETTELQGLWAKYEDGTNNIKNGYNGTITLMGFYRTHIYQQNVQGKYIDGVVLSLEDKDNNNSTTYDYSYKNGELTYNHTTVSVKLEDSNHLLMDGTIHWTKLKDWLNGYYEPEQIDLSKYEAHADSACWRLTAKNAGVSMSEYMWGNEFDIASTAKTRLITAQAKGTLVSYTWEKSATSTKESCGVAPSQN